MNKFLSNSIHAVVTCRIRNKVLSLLHSSESDGWRVDLVHGALTGLVDEIRALKDRVTSANVDKVRGIDQARLIAEDCDHHGQEIRFLRHQAWTFSALHDQCNEERTIYLGAVEKLRRTMERADTIWAQEIGDYLEEVEKDANRARARARRNSVPSEADCLRAGHCEHPDTEPHGPCKRLRSLT